MTDTFLEPFVIPPPPPPRLEPEPDDDGDLHIPSYCLECDAPEGGCEHTGRRYLGHVVYQLLEGDSPATFVWRASLADAARMEAGSGVANVRPEAGDTPVPHGDLLSELERRTYCDDRVMSLLADAYDADALRTSRAVAGAIEAFDLGKLRSLGGIVVKRLREIVDREDR